MIDWIHVLQLPFSANLKSTLYLSTVNHLYGSLNVKGQLINVKSTFQFVIDALKLLRKMNIMDESVLMELMAQFIDGDDSVRSLVQVRVTKLHRLR